jgi:hypothetical protein
MIGVFQINGKQKFDAKFKKKFGMNNLFLDLMYKLEIIIKRK